MKPRLVALALRPAGWWSVSESGKLATVIAWGRLDDGEVVGLVAGRGLRIARGRGFLPAQPLGGEDAVQLNPPDGINFPPADLVAAIGEGALDAGHRAEIERRLRSAVDDSDWCRQAYVSYITDAPLFLARHLNRVAEHMYPADLNKRERKFLAGLIPGNPRTGAEVRPLSKETPS